MSLRSGPAGYGLATKFLHWLTLGALVAQFVVGYTMSDDAEVAKADCDPSGEGRSGGDTTGVQEQRLDLLEERCEQAQDLREEQAEDPVGSAFSDLGSGEVLDGGLSLPELHLLLGVLIIALAVVRLFWRRYDGLPPWSEQLSERQRRLVTLTERSLLGLLFVVPATGLVLVATGDDDVLPLHIGAHVAFFVVLAAHLGTNLRPRILTRML